MKKKLMLCVLAAALGLSSAFSLAFAQTDWSAASAAMGADGTAASQSSDGSEFSPAGQSPGSGAASEVTAAAEKAGGADGEEAEETVQAEVAEEATPEPEPVVEVVEETPAAVPAAVVQTPQKTKEPAETDDSWFGMGVRGAVGASAFQGHKAIKTMSYGNKAIQLGMSYSASAGLSIVICESSFISYAVDALYSIYQARGEFTLKTTGSDFGVLNQAGVELHSVDVPILVRINLGSSENCSRFYFELGPQVGANVYGKIYANNEMKKPYLNQLAFGPAAGFGIAVNNSLIGVRGYFNALEYAENSSGRQWAVHAGVTTYCLKL